MRCWVSFNRSKVNNILVISLSNLGDVILTFPVIDILLRDFPAAKFTVVVGPKAVTLFEGNPRISRVLIYNKRDPLKDQIRWFLQLRRDHFDLIVDLRHTFLPFALVTKYRTSLRVPQVPGQHMRKKHLNRLKGVFDFGSESAEPRAFFISPADIEVAQKLIQEVGNQKFLIVGPGAANHLKRWTTEGFAALCDHLAEKYWLKIVLVGDQADGPTVEAIAARMKHKPLNLCGQTSLQQLAYLLSCSQGAIVNDSAIMHLASYLNVPVLAIFGPTDPNQYGPWSSRSRVVTKKMTCLACQNPKSSNDHRCMENIKAEEIFKTVRLTNEGMVFEHHGSF